MAWLARQAEVFAFFTADNKAKDGAASKKGGKKKAKNAGRGGAKRMAEADEDEQMVANAMNEKQPRATRLTVQPTCIKFGTMRAYQIEGLNWLISLYERGINGILADEMGLGKTLQAISILGYLKEARGISGPHLVIVPKSVLGNWCKEFARWCPSINVLKLQGDKAERARMLSEDMVAGTSKCSSLYYSV